MSDWSAHTRAEWDARTEFLRARGWRLEAAARDRWAASADFRAEGDRCCRWAGNRHIAASGCAHDCHDKIRADNKLLCQPGPGLRMRFAYADPPYPGQSADLYANHPDYAGEVDHAELIDGLVLGYPDGWALSTSARALRMVLPLCPEDAWVAAWYKTNAPPVRTTRRFIWSWEPVIVWRGRDGFDLRVRDALACGQGYGFPGQKPPAFTRWIVALLGATDADTIDDVFPGSGAVAAELSRVRRQPTLAAVQETLDGEIAPKNRRYAGLPGSKSHRVI